jgi:hypothetical protein
VAYLNGVHGYLEPHAGVFLIQKSGTEKQRAVIPDLKSDKQHPQAKSKHTGFYSSKSLNAFFAKKFV